jgi:DNA-directed RNA polymerase specialized sigma24 family protein
MTPQVIQATEKDLQTELDQLTYSAYLLTLDPGKAFSAVARALEGSPGETTPNSALLERTVELALEEVLFESEARWDGESSAYDVLLYGRSAAINSKAFQSLQDLNGSSILLLDSTSRIAFVLHHLLGFKISDAAVKARLTEKQYRAQLRRAYLQLASFRLENGTRASHGVEQVGSAWEQNYELVEMDSCLLV